MTSSCGRTCRTAPNSSSAPFSNAWNPTSMRGSFFFAMARMMPWPRAGCIGPDRETGPQTGEKALYTLASRPYGAPHRAKRRGPAPEMKRMDQFKSKVAPADGKLAVLLPGMGAVATALIAGVEAVKAGLSKPIGSLPQMAHIRLGKRSEKRWARIKDLVPLSHLDDLVFGGWDPIPDDAYTAAAKAKVLSPEHLAQLKPSLSQIKPMAAVFDRNVVKRLEVAIGGKDFKTGQTLMKTISAPGLKARMLGMEGWFSTNILGNRDGEVLDDPANFKTKEVSKLSVLEQILEPERYPDLYSHLQHKVSIHYYKPRGDNKEGWDNIDIVGWMGYPMQIKVNFLCRDSILAAPIVLDLALFGDLAARAGMKGIQEWLSFYFKSPQHAAPVSPEHDLFVQKVRLENNLRYLVGEELINYLGSDYKNE